MTVANYATPTESEDLQRYERQIDLALAELDHRALTNVKAFLHSLTMQVSILADIQERREAGANMEQDAARERARAGIEEAGGPIMAQYQHHMAKARRNLLAVE